MSFFPFNFQMVLTRSQFPIAKETKLASVSNKRKLSEGLSPKKKYSTKKEEGGQVT